MSIPMALLGVATSISLLTSGIADALVITVVVIGARAHLPLVVNEGTKEYGSLQWFG